MGKIKMLSKKILFVNYLTIILLFLCIPAFSSTIDINASAREKQFKYVNNQIIVKLKEKEKPEVLFGQRYSVRYQKHKNILSKLKNKYKLRNEKPVFKGLHDGMKRRNISLKQLNSQKINKLLNVNNSMIKSVRQPDLFSIYILKSDNDLVKTSVALSKDPNVEYAEPNYLMKIQMVPNDHFYSTKSTWGQHYSDGTPYDDLWGLKKIKCEQAWDLSQGEDVVVAVIDTGVDYTHPDLVANMWTDGNGHYGYNFVNNNNDVMDGNGHGTHVAGTIAAVGNNAIGVIGVSPTAKIMAVKGLDDEGSGYVDDLAESIIYAADNGAKILNNSWGPSSRTPSIYTLEQAVDYAYSVGCVIVFAAGNSNDDVSYYSPANYSKTIAVAASTQDDTKCSFSNYGKLIDVTAPGGGYTSELGGNQNILSTMPNDCKIANDKPGLKISDGYYRLAGTSMACPHVAGVIALMLSRNPSLTNEEVRSMLQMSSDDIGDPGRDDYFGYGRVNAYEAICIARTNIVVSSPTNQSYVRGTNVEIYGSAFIEADFEKYELYYKDKNATEPTLITRSFVPQENGVLGVWDTTQCADGAGTLTLKLFDTKGKTLMRSVEIIVDNINEPPAFQGLSNKIAVINRLLEFKAEVSDPDDPATPSGQLKGISAMGLPPGATFNTDTHIFSWQSSESDKGIYNVIFTASDNKYTTTETITISTLYLKDTLITSGETSGARPIWSAYDEGKLVGARFEDGNNSIYMYDMATGEEMLIANGNGSSIESPAIYGNTIVFFGYQNGKWNICIYDIPTGNAKVINADVAQQLPPGIYQDMIVWPDKRNNESGWDIYAYNISTGKETRLNINGRQHVPQIYENNIVWVDYRNNEKGDIYLYDISTGEEVRLSVDPGGSPFSPQIYKNKMACTIMYGSFWTQDIYVYDIARGAGIRLTEDTYFQTDPIIYENLIAWYDKRNQIKIGTSWFYVPEVYLYDTDMGAEARITYSNTGGSLIDMRKNKIFWSDGFAYSNVNGHHTQNTYMTEILFPPRITSVNPTAVSPSQIITITGNNFGYEEGDSQVFLNETVLSVETWSNAEITCRVPTGTKTGLLKVNTLGGQSNEIEISICASPVEIIRNICQAIASRPSNRFTPPDRVEPDFDLNNDGNVNILDFCLARDIHILPNDVFTRVFTKIMNAVNKRIGLIFGDKDFIAAFDADGDNDIQEDDYDWIYNALSVGR